MGILSACAWSSVATPHAQPQIKSGNARSGPHCVTSNCAFCSGVAHVPVELHYQWQWRICCIAQAMCAWTMQVVRAGKQVHEGKIVSLRRVKDDVKEIGSGQECGVGVESFSDWRENDHILAFEIVSKRQTLESAGQE